MDKHTIRKTLKYLYKKYTTENTSKIPAYDVWRVLHIDNIDLNPLWSSGLVKHDARENLYLSEEGVQYMDRVFKYYQKMAGRLINGEMENKDKAERAFKKVDQEIENGNSSPRDPESRPITNNFIWSSGNLLQHSGIGDNVGGNKNSGENPSNFTIIATIISILIALASIPWWPAKFSYIRGFAAIMLDSPNDPSQVFNEPIFDLVGNMEKLNSDLRKEQFIEEFSGMWVQASESFATTTERKFFYVTAEISGFSMAAQRSTSLYCVFDRTWFQRISHLNPGKQVSFRGRINKYDSSSGRLVLSDCSLLR